MKFLIYLTSILLSTTALCETTSATVKESFVCNPSPAIKNRVNEHCIQAMDVAVEYKSEKIIPIRNGKLFLTSTNTEDGSVSLKLAHQCNGKNKTKWTTFPLFCGYQKSILDRESPAIKEIRQEISRQKNLSEEKSQKEIDAFVAEQINQWIADPKNNIVEENAVIKIKTLKNTMGVTCYGAQDLSYKINCKKGAL
jgi:hypothetical protein